MDDNDAVGAVAGNGIIEGRPRNSRKDRLVTFLSVSVAVAVGVFGLAACGSSPSTPGVASVGSTTSAPSAASGAGNAQLDKYGACMRSHGLPQYQNPVKDGDTISFPATNLTSPQYKTAQAACGDLLPAGLGPHHGGVPVADQNDYLKAAACLRSHGFPTFPDPTFAGGTVHFTAPPGVDQSSPQFQQAFATCRKLIPAGLPYSS